ncbi:MAG: response regulator [Acidobacteria bacterium]|nr:response regulator [Acidobacteriota bacterium]
MTTIDSSAENGTPARSGDAPATRAPEGAVPLRRRLFLLTAAAILPLAIMAGLALSALTRSQRQQAQRAGTEIARALATAVDGELMRSVSVLEALGTSPLLEAGELRGFHELARRVAATRSHWQSILLQDAAGHVVLSTRSELGTRAPGVSEPETLALAIATGKPQIGYLTRGPEGALAFPVSLPIVQEGIVRYVLSAVLLPSSMLDVIARQRLPNDWIISVFDERLQRVARSRQHEAFLGAGPAPTLRDLVARFDHEGSGLTSTLEGEQVYTAFSRSPVTGWTVAIGMPRSAAEAGASASLATYGTGIVLSIVIGAIVALLIARSVTRPIAQLRRAAVALGRREPFTPPSTGVQELDEVAESLASAATERAQGDRQRDDLLAREQQAREIAEAANRAKDEFLAMLGHELRNPLGAISNASRLLDDPRAARETSTRARAIIRRQVDHLARMTDDLLDAARAMTGKIMLQRQPIDLAAAAADVVSSRQFAQHVVTVLEPAWVNADATRLAQMIENLLSNAAKYTPTDGTITVTVSRDADRAVLRVTDTGAGMPSDLVDRVFEPFVQGERSLDRAHGGLGIGLTLVRRLAELHGGSATAASDGPGAGSTFTIDLPAIAASGARAPAAARGTSPLERTVLVVEDNDDAREMLEDLLRLDGHHVVVARDGETALTRLHEQRVDLALIDLGLPGMTGYDLARRIRAAAPAGRSRPVLVALTGYGLPSDRARSAEAGFDRHLVKPVSPEVLTDLLRSAG